MIIPLLMIVSAIENPGKQEDFIFCTALKRYKEFKEVAYSNVFEGNYLSDVTRYENEFRERVTYHGRYAGTLISNACFYATTYEEALEKREQFTQEYKRKGWNINLSETPI